MQQLPFRLPGTLASALRGRAWVEIQVGKSGARVLRFDADLVLKRMRRDAKDPLLGGLEPERQRLAWLAGRLPVPRVLHFEQDASHDYLLISALAGTDASAAARALSPSRLVELLADACRAFHAVPATNCPFEASVETLMAAARARLESGKVDGSDFDPIRQGRDPHDLFAELLALRPRGEESVLCHGDFCLPNVLLDGERCSGFVDLGRMGVADRHLDLALCRRSIAHNLGEQWSAPFLKAYGGTCDPAKLAFFQLLDEFF